MSDMTDYFITEGFSSYSTFYRSLSQDDHRHCEDDGLHLHVS